MTRAAIYSRFSSDLQNDKSIKAQERVCREYAKREGWKVMKTFSDEGISGGKTDRPGYQELLTAIRDKQFDIILCVDISRIWRDEAEQARCVKELQYLETHIVGIGDGVDTRREGYQILLALHGVMNADFRRKIAKRTFEGLKEVALEGRSAGGRAYGYRPTYKPIKDDKGRPMMKPTGREIVLEEAKVVRKIFRWFADGNSPRWIASELNRLGVPSPGSSWNRKARRKDKWMGSTIHGSPDKGTGILNNDLYRGSMIWNRSRWVEKPNGKKERRERPRDEWVIVAKPSLRIVDDELWQAVKDRQEVVRKSSTPIREALHRSSHSGASPKFLFSGLLVCSECGSRFVMISGYQYGCATYTNGGEHACGNKLRVSRALVEELLPDGIQNDLYREEVLTYIERETYRLLREAKRNRKPEKAQLEVEHRKAESKVENIMKAIEAGIITDTTKGRLEKAEAEAKRLQKALSPAAMKEVERIPDIIPNLMARIKRVIHDFPSILRDVAKARYAVRQMIGDEIPLAPHESGKYLVATLTGNYQGLLALAGGRNGKLNNMVAGAGFEPTTFGL